MRIALVVAVAMVSACTSEPASSSNGASAPTSATSVQQHETFEVFVQTRKSGECNDDVAAGGLDGDCWLPGYEQPGSDRVLNQDNDDPKSPCRSVEVSKRKDSQKGCRPQPGEKVRVVCDIERGGITYRGFILEEEWRLTDASSDAVYTPDGEQIVWNLDIFLELPVNANKSVPACSF